MKKTLKVGFVGGGINSAVGKAHKIALQMDDNFELVAGCFSRNQKVNSETAIAWGVDEGRTYSSVGEMLVEEAEKLDAVVVLTPTPSHKDIVIDCLKAGFDVICEKALALDVAEVEQIKIAKEASSKKLVVTYNYTGYPMVRELKSRIESGQIGKLEQILVEMPQESFSRVNTQGSAQPPQAWRLTDHSIPTVSLDLGVHVHQMISFLSGEVPLRVVGVESRLGNFKEVVDNVHCLARYSNDLICNIWYGKTACGNRNGLRVRVFGTKGSFEWYQMNPEQLIFSDNRGGQSLLDRTTADNIVANKERYSRFKAGHPSGFIEAFSNYYHDVADFLQNGNSEYVFGVDVALEGLAFLEKVHESSIIQF